MFISKWLKYGVIPFAVVISCRKPIPTLDNINLQEWKSDKLACLAKRSTMVQAIEDQSEKLLALNEQEIIGLLGRPDENELYTRNQKFFYYFVQPSKACSNAVSADPKKLVIRFNAMGLAKEVSVE